MTDYQMILTRTEGRVGIVQINRPDALNALNAQVLSEITTALRTFDNDDTTGCVILTGNDKAFAAGADIKAMAQATVVEMMNSPMMQYWEAIRDTQKPLIAAVNGWCLGGGCELAMICDLIIAGEGAKFGQPEINLAIIPGAGGTQRLTRAVGKAVAMDMVLSGRRLSAQEALGFGLVSRVAPDGELMTLSMEVAAAIADKAPVALRLAKDAVNAAFETTLAEGIRLERRLFTMLFATEDQKEGMAAFIEKRKPVWRGQ
ncbi:MAG: enoyl-CoA hydratase/isomerase family protein [Caldilineaceae bacterium]|nr:enoyl-CoA hydratase/isomerase family protein [Caldilineaceae bacterium]